MEQAIPDNNKSSARSGGQPLAMPRLQLIFHHPLYGQELSQIDHLEKDRIYCGHGLDHLLSVARIGWIYAAEHQLSLDRELWYSCALLHDIGRARQYTEKIPHQKGGKELAKQILRDCHYDEKEIQSIAEAIEGHRGSIPPAPKTMAELLIWADKKSRNCFCCSASGSCDWPPQKRTDQLCW